MPDRRDALAAELPPTPERLRAAIPVFAQWLSRRRTLIGLLRRSKAKRYKFARILATKLQISQAIPDNVLDALLRHRSLLGLLRRNSVTAAGIVDQIVQLSLPDAERTLPPGNFRTGAKKYDPARQNVLLAVHQTSRTGAPVLGWNIAGYLAERYNLFTFTLGGGPLLQDFLALSIETHGPFSHKDTNPATLDLAMRKLFERHQFKYAIINSAESQSLVAPCASHAIRTVFLLHEFASYIQARNALRTAFDLASEIVFPARLVAESSVKMHPALRNRPIRILPQGMSVLPKAGGAQPAKPHPALQELAAARAQGAMIVLGAGTVAFRKGVDLFLTAAMRVCRANQKFRFLWVGEGYQPDADLAYSIYLREQVERAGLGDRMIFLDEQPNLEPVYALADMFLLSSRLDPMPNVTIDAAHRGIPVICFDQASGMADILKSDPKTALCVVDYLDTAMAADVILQLAGDRAGLAQLAAATQRLANTVFDMAKYVEALDRLGTNASGPIIATEPTEDQPIYSSSS